MEKGGNALFQSNMPQKILIAVCTYDGKIEASCALSIVQNMRYLDRKGYEPELHFTGYMCYIPVARNSCIKYFLESEATDLIFVDADLTFGTHSIYKLLQHDVDIVAGAYPYKQELEQFTCAPITHNGNVYMTKGGLIAAEYAPTGLMRIKRSTIEAMLNKRPSLKNKDGSYTIFDTGFLWDDGVWYGEDIAFCKMWREMGGKLWIEPDITFGHKGHKEYTGNYKRYLETTLAKAE